ncbi:hypothetical protein M3689_05560 [Alkalihalophilus marmarensis]|uniref:phage protein n=1 Tax=Alkalihalophilus marmarensis TaxID=521377 RepID=UPI00203D51E0|nr:hypothetical protein [Alkalihalophilus marmarensis]MCM3488773.1 hypothetical protein [Alkalihalophilus marmarensis]
MSSFIRKTEVLVGGKKFITPDLNIEFRIEFSDGEELNDAEIKIYNLSDQSVNLIKKNLPLVINAGYEGDIGNVFIGGIYDVFTERTNTDRITTILAVEASDQWQRMNITKTYKAGIKASQILRDLIGFTGLATGALSIPRDVTYSRGKSLSGKLPNIVKDIAKDAGAKATVTKGKIFIRDPQQGDTLSFQFTPNRGLIGTPERFEDEEAIGYNVKALLNHRVQTDSIIQVGSSTAKGRFRVRKGVHLSNSSSFYTEMEVVE